MSYRCWKLDGGWLPLIFNSAALYFCLCVVGSIYRAVILFHSPIPLNNAALLKSIEDKENSKSHRRRSSPIQRLGWWMLSRINSKAFDSGIVSHKEVPASYMSAASIVKKPVKYATFCHIYSFTHWL